MNTEKELTGYPSIDKPWLKYYSDYAKNTPLPSMTMFDYAWENNKNALDDIAFRYFDAKITYRNFFSEVDMAAKAFWNFGIRAGDIVVIMSLHTPETTVALYALNYIGAIAYFLYPTLSKNEVVKTLNDTESKLLLVLEPVFEKVFDNSKDINADIVVLPISDSMPWLMRTMYSIKNRKKATNGLRNVNKWRDFIKEQGSSSTVEKASDSNATAVIVSTSGTTGEPKGVCLSNNNMNDLSFQESCGLVGFKRKENCLLILPPFIGFGIVQLHILISNGIETILQIKLDNDCIEKAFFKYKPYCFLTGPVNAERILNHGKADLSHVRYFFGGGGELTEKQEETINAYLKDCNSIARYSNGYGMTETATILCLNVNDISKRGSIGLPLSRTVVKVVDNETLRELKYNEIGELWFNTPCIMNGYYKNQSATDEIILTDENGVRWLRTGDLGCVDEDGFVYFKGRLKRLFVTRGIDGMPYKIFPQRIEELFTKQDGVRLCGVIVREDKKRINVPIAFVVLQDGYKSPQEQIIERLAEISANELPEHMRPQEIIMIDDMPITASGKIDYTALEKWQKKSNE